MSDDMKNIALTFLNDNEFDGLFNTDHRCACLFNNLMPGDNCPTPYCEPGVRLILQGNENEKSKMCVGAKPYEVTV